MELNQLKEENIKLKQIVVKFFSVLQLFTCLYSFHFLILVNIKMCRLNLKGIESKRYETLSVFRVRLSICICFMKLLCLSYIFHCRLCRENSLKRDRNQQKS